MRPLRPFSFRQSLKPLLEKRRRARINQSLSQLKGLVLPLLGAEVCVWELGKPRWRVPGHPVRRVGQHGPGAPWGPEDLLVGSERWSGPRDWRAPGYKSEVPSCPVYYGVSLLSGLAQTSRCSKLEKADILEMTVRFLQEQPASPYSTAVSGE